MVPAPLELVSPAIPDGECFLEEWHGETVVTLGQVGVADALQRVGQAPLILGGASQLRGLYEVLPCQDRVGRVQPAPIVCRQRAAVEESPAAFASVRPICARS